MHYVVDHIKAFAHAGTDTPSDTQRQTITDSKAEDRWERKGSFVSLTRW